MLLKVSASDRARLGLVAPSLSRRSHWPQNCWRSQRLEFGLHFVFAGFCLSLMIRKVADGVNNYSFDSKDRATFPNSRSATDK
jgi:hypothetical protein